MLIRCAIFLVFLLCGCTRIDEQAVRHVVTAELMDRYKVPEGEVRIIEVRSANAVSLVRAEIRDGGRAGAHRDVLCTVERKAPSSSAQARWTVTTIEENR